MPSCVRSLKCYGKVSNPCHVAHWPRHGEDLRITPPYVPYLSTCSVYNLCSSSQHVKRLCVCVCVCVCERASEWVCVCMFVDALCVQTFSMRADFVHGYCCGFSCALSHVLECVHLHRSVCECARAQTHMRTRTPHAHAHTSLLAV